jgi:coproporphyrinogen III oxidase-like Fe-S oxidoreductase
MNLRLGEGLDLAAYERRWGIKPDAGKIAALKGEGFLTLHGDTLTATPSGRLLLNRVIEALLN